MGLVSRLSAIGPTWKRKDDGATNDAPKGCVHRRSDRTLWVDCTDCRGPQNLENDVCRKSILLVLSREWRVDEIVLSRDSDVLYSCECTELLSRIAGLVRLCRELSESSVVRSECGGCSHNPRSVLRSLADRIISHPIDLNMDFHFTKSGREGICRGCSDRIESCMEQVRKEHEAIRTTLARIALRVREEG